MTQPPTGSASRETDDAEARKMKERVLVFIVAFLGLLIVAGIAAVVLRIIYLSSTPVAQPAISSEGGGAGTTEAARLELPPGAVVKSVSASGDRLAVHYETPAGSGIVVLDLATGAVLRRVEIAPGATR
ncbi:hypothetical protein [Hyphomicrobium sp.]|uniref:hypothetical protein n=1 Tax=Hyphomicrobium sp. TaxID=82 RepID=UPI002E33CF34|nr:hypothetical protein [Hyphomicrobium sp.]HEX2842251.1 hypothetical protein [Hyphomicrobium sp.]